MNIFFDLDGTLLDISKRYYQVHAEAAKIANFSKISFKKYWSLKKQGLSEDKILKTNPRGKSFKLYEKVRIELLEEKEFLKLDKPFFWVPRLLNKLFLQKSLFIVTVRRSRKNLHNQLKNMKIDKVFKDVLSSSSNTNPILAKEKLIEAAGFSNKDIIIGDTEVDIIIAQKLGIKSVAVLSGIRTSKYLRKFNPDFLVKNAFVFFKDQGKIYGS